LGGGEVVLVELESGDCIEDVCVELRTYACVGLENGFGFLEDLSCEFDVTLDEIEHPEFAVLLNCFVVFGSTHLLTYSYRFFHNFIALLDIIFTVILKIGRNIKDITQIWMFITKPKLDNFSVLLDGLLVLLFC
jgi:hypothetical protein